MARRIPALALLGFLNSRDRDGDDKNDIVHFVPFSTTNACDASPTLAAFPAMDANKVVKDWVTGWRMSGFLPSGSDTGKSPGSTKL